MIFLTTLSVDLPNECELINSFFEKGLDVLHINKPDKNYIQLMAYISAINEEYHSQIVVHQHHDLAEDFILKGIYVQQESRINLGEDFGLYVSNFTNQSYDVSTSFNSTDEALLYKETPLSYSFIAMSEIKKATEAGFKVKEVLGLPMSFIATEGISVIGVGLIQKMGFDGINLSNEIWSSTNPVSLFELMKKEVVLNFK